MDTRLARALAGVTLATGLALSAWEASAQQAAPATNAPATVASPAVSAPAQPVIMIPSTNSDATAANSVGPTNSVAPVQKPTPAVKPTVPPGPPLPVRTRTAIMQVLDKVTAETLRFEAPVGRPIRYKTMVLMVKACEMRGLSDPQPRPSAYLVIDTQAASLLGRPPPPPKRVYTGWMFANGPAIHPMQHPIYDVWLMSCAGA